MKVRRLLLVLAMALTGGFATAQSASDIALAKQLAKQQGYSDAQIEAMMNQYNNGDKSTSAKTSQTIDRNAAAMDQQQMMQQRERVTMEKARQDAARAALAQRNGVKA